MDTTYNSTLKGVKSDTLVDMGEMCICIDSIHQHSMSGYIGNKYMTEFVWFQTIAELVLGINDACDQLQFPDETTERSGLFQVSHKKYNIERSMNAIQRIAFEKTQRQRFSCGDTALFGRLATIFIHIHYREHSNIQGVLEYQQKGNLVQVCFCTALELLWCLDEISVLLQRENGSIYDQICTQEALQKNDIESRMELALNNEEFEVYLQAQYTLSNAALTSAEALVRWKTADGKIMMPSEFIPTFEENGFLLRLDHYVFEKVCANIRERLDQGLLPVEISVNFSRRHLSDIAFVSKLCAVADRYQVPHHLLVMELTETIFVVGEASLLRMVEDLHHYGFRLAIDDFGAGYSSLALLKNIPVDILKIDRSFFINNLCNTRSEALLGGILQIAKSLEMTTVAEGIESDSQADFLKINGCDLVQSFLYAKPVPMCDFWIQGIVRRNISD